MSEGLSLATANEMLDVLGTGLWAQMHVATPGPDGDINLAFVTDRAEVVFAPASDASKIASATVDWPSPWSGGEQNVSHLSFWTASSGGTFRFSLRLNDVVTYTDGVTPRLTLAAVTTPSVAE